MQCNRNCNIQMCNLFGFFFSLVFLYSVHCTHTYRKEISFEWTEQAWDFSRWRKNNREKQNIFEKEKKNWHVHKFNRTKVVYILSNSQTKKECFSFRFFFYFLQNMVFISISFHFSIHSIETETESQLQFSSFWCNWADDMHICSVSHVHFRIGNLQFFSFVYLI